MRAVVLSLLILGATLSIPTESRAASLCGSDTCFFDGQNYTLRGTLDGDRMIVGSVSPASVTVTGSTTQLTLQGLFGDITVENSSTMQVQNGAVVNSSKDTQIFDGSTLTVSKGSSLSATEFLVERGGSATVTGSGSVVVAQDVKTDPFANRLDIANGGRVQALGSVSVWDGTVLSAATR